MFYHNTQIGQEVVVRLDKATNTNSLPAIAHNRKLRIILKEIPDINLLKSIAASIQNITYIIDKKTTKAEIKKLSLIGRPIVLVSKDKKNIDKIRLKFIDYDIGLIEDLTKKDCGIKNITKNMKFLSKKNVVSNGQIYNSYLSENKTENKSNVEDSPLFWEDLDHFRIYKDNT